jgi:hypothetical protein
MRGEGVKRRGEGRAELSLSSMAVLGATTHDRQITLGRRNLVGRGASCVVRNADKRVSGEHATLSWSGLHWQLRDLGSHNGTLLNGKRLAHGAHAKLSRGDVIEFGCPEARWSLLDDGPPRAFARCVADGRVVNATHGSLLLPDADHPQICVAQLEGTAWEIESGGERRIVADQELVLAGGQAWRLFLPSSSDTERTSTSEPPLLLRELKVGFYVSLDEEHVEICLRSTQRDLLLVPRAHHYMLLTLARAKQHDSSASQAESESEWGWLHSEALATALRVDIEKLNVDIFRARRQFLEAGVVDAHSLVERRHHSRALRLGLRSFEICRGARPEPPPL